MGARQMTLSELSEPVRAFLSQVGEGGGLVISDEAGHVRFGVISYVEAPLEEKERAWEDLRRIQRHVAESMRDQGINEADVDEILRDD